MTVATRLRLKPSKPLNKRPPAPEPDAFAAEAVTVAWMLTVITTLACELGSAAGRAYLAIRPNAQVAAVLSEVLLLSAALVGLISLVLTAAVLKVRRAAPPRGITVFAIIIGSAPAIAVLLRLMLRS